MKTQSKTERESVIGLFLFKGMVFAGRELRFSFASSDAAMFLFILPAERKPLAGFDLPASMPTPDPKSTRSSDWHLGGLFDRLNSILNIIDGVFFEVNFTGMERPITGMENNGF